MAVDIQSQWQRAIKRSRLVACLAASSTGDADPTAPEGTIYSLNGAPERERVPPRATGEERVNDGVHDVLYIAVKPESRATT